MLEQIVSGIHTRLYARAYIVADPTQDRYSCCSCLLLICLTSSHLSYSNVTAPIFRESSLHLQQPLCLREPGCMHGISGSHSGGHGKVEGNTPYCYHLHSAPTCQLQLLHVSTPMSVFVPYCVCLCADLVCTLLSVLHPVSVPCTWACRAHTPAN